MAYPIKHFFKKLEGKTIYDFSRNLDYSLTQAERIQKVKELLYTQDDNKYLDPFFEDVFEQRMEKRQGKWVDTSYVRLLPKSSDGLSLDINVCKELERLASYILFSPDGERITKKTKYNFYPEEMFEEQLKKEKVFSDIKYDSKIYDTVIDFLENKGINYKKEIKQKIYENDYEDSDIGIYLKQYKEVVDVLKEKLKDGNLSLEKKKLYKSMLKEISYNMIYTKDHLKGTIYFKAVGADSNDIDYDKFDFFDKEHIYSLLRCNNRNVITDVGCLVTDLDNLIKKIKLSPTDIKILELYRSDVKISHEKISELLGLTRQYVTQQLNKIINRIIKEYYRVYEDWYYLNVCKGRYKQCSKCGEIKLATDTYFNKNSDSKDGFYSVCKQCRCELN